MAAAKKSDVWAGMRFVVPSNMCTTIDSVTAKANVADFPSKLIRLYPSKIMSMLIININISSEVRVNERRQKPGLETG